MEIETKQEVTTISLKIKINHYYDESQFLSKKTLNCVKITYV